MLAGILSHVTTLIGRLTAARAAYLDKLNITGNVADGSVYTSARATKIDNLDAAITTRAASATALSTATWTTARAGKLDKIAPIVQIKRQASGLYNFEITPLNPHGNYGYFHPNPHYFDVGDDSIIKNDYRGGLRFATSTDSSDALIDVVNTSAAGWLLGVVQFNTYAAGARTCQAQIILDSTTLFDSTLAALATSTYRLPLGIVGYWVTTGGTAYEFPALSPYPVRFETNITIKHRCALSSVRTTVVYILD